MRRNNYIGKIGRGVWQFARDEWPLVLLAALFIFQIFIFNQWTGIYLKREFFTRLLVFNLGLSAVLFVPAALFGRRKHRYAYLLLIELVLVVTMVSQYLFYAYSTSFLQASVIRYLDYAGQVASSAKTLPTGPVLFLLSPLAVLAVLAWLDTKPRNYVARHLKLRTVGALLAVFVLCVGYTGFRDGNKFSSIAKLFSTPYDSGSLIHRVGIIGYGGLDLRRYLATPRDINQAEREFVAGWAAKNPREETPAQYFGAAKGKNLIIIQSESFERFVLNRKVNGQEITPNLNRFIKESLYFPNFYYSIGPGHTIDAEFVTLNSLLPLQDRVIAFEYPVRKYQTLANQLREAGYSAEAYHANNSTFWNRANFYPGQGFEGFHDETEYKSDQSIGWGIPDRDFFTQTAEILKGEQQPFFAQVISLTLHSPFDLPEDERKLKITKDLGLDWIQENYLQVANYYDRAFGEFMRQLKEHGLYEDSVIALYGDHTAFLAKPGNEDYAKFLGINPADRLAYFKSAQVPLVIRAPGVKPGAVDAPLGQLDLYPTLANLLGIRPPGSVLGKDALNSPEPLGISLRFNTKIIDAIESDSLLYFASEEGSFETSQCLDRNTEKAVSLSRCRPMYDDVLAKLKVSELVIRGNAVHLLNSR